MESSFDAVPEETPTRLHPRDILHAVRVRQWAKNVLLLAGFVFAGRLRAPREEMLTELGRVLLALACFCALSGAAYLLNDYADRERDSLHPKKKHRPIASGRLSIPAAFFLFCLLCAIGVACAWGVRAGEPAAGAFPFCAALYFSQTLGYSFHLKNVVLVDVLILAFGFVLRVVAGCLAVPVAISPWILLCTFTLALFIALCKRRAELLEIGAQAQTRQVLAGYTVPMLDTFISIAAGLTITSYGLYTFNSHTIALGRFKDTPLLMLSIPFVVYGIFRYLLLAHSSPVGGEPEQMLRDKPLMLNVALWGALVATLTLLEKL